MRKSAFAGLLACAIIFATGNSQVSAQTPDVLKIENPANLSEELAVIELVEEVEEKSERPPKQSAPVEHTVVDNETLIEIAKQYKTTWQRLYAKNTRIDHPDMIEAGDKVTIPKPDEILPTRELPEPPTPEPVQARAAAVPNEPAKPAPKRQQPVPRRSVRRGSTAGNLYVRGYCTWYAKNRRPDLPNNLGNAITWVSRARAQGIPTGSAPRAGAIGQRGNHVVYVESVNGNGTVTISDMNFRGWNVISRRTVPASHFTYIY